MLYCSKLHYLTVYLAIQLFKLQNVSNGVELSTYTINVEHQHSYMQSAMPL